jgi:hypothetical protein
LAILLITFSSEAYNKTKSATNSILSYFSVSGNIISGIRILAPAIVAAAMNEGLLARNYPPLIVNALQSGGIAMYFFWGPIKVRIDGWIKGSSSGASGRRGGDLTTPIRKLLFNGQKNNGWMEPEHGGNAKHHRTKHFTNKNRKANKTKKPRRTLNKNKKSKHNSSQKKNKNKRTKTKKHKRTIRRK